MDLVVRAPYAFTAVPKEGSEPSLVGKSQDFKYAIYEGTMENGDFLFRLNLYVAPDAVKEPIRNTEYSFRATPKEGSEPSLGHEEREFDSAFYRNKDADGDLFFVLFLLVNPAGVNFAKTTSSSST